MQVEDSAPYLISSQRWKAWEDASSFTAEPAEECMLPYFTKLQSGSDVGFSHRLVVRPVARPCEQLNLVHLDGIMVGGIGGKNSETAVETLRTATAVGMKLSDVVDPRAADGMLDQVSAAVIDDRSNNIPFSSPDEGIVNLNRLAGGRAEELAKMAHDQWMSGARCGAPTTCREIGKLMLTTPFSKNRILLRPKRRATTQASAA